MKELPDWRQNAPAGVSLEAAMTRSAATHGRPARWDGLQQNVQLERLVQPKAMGRWMLPRLSSVTPTYIETVLSSGLSGDQFGQWELFQLMEDTWPRLTKNLNEIKRAVRQMDWTVAAWTEEDAAPTTEAEARRRLVSNGLWKMRPTPGSDENGFLDTVYDLLDAWGKGVSMVEILWDTRIEPGFGHVALPRASAWVSPQDWLWTPEGTVGLRGDAGAEALPPYKFLVAVSRSRTGHPLGTALLRPLAWWWCAANFSANWLLNLAQLFGLPLRWAQYEPGAAPAVIKAICDMLENMGSAGWAAFPAGTQLELVESNKNAGSFPQIEMLDRADKQCDLLVLGQTLTTDVGESGSRALGDVHASVRDEVVSAAAEWIEDVLNQQLVPAILELNFGDTEMAPEITAERRTVEDAKANAERDAILIGAGIDIPKAFLYGRHNIPMPKPGEEVIGKPATPVPPESGGSDADGPPDDDEAGDDDEEETASEVSAARAGGGRGKKPAAATGGEAQEVVEDIVRMAVADAAGIRARWLAPLKVELDRLIRAAKDKSITDEVLMAFVADAARSMPELFERLNIETLARHIEVAMGAAAVEGVKARVRGE